MREKTTNRRSSTALRISSPTNCSLSQKASSLPAIRILFIILLTLILLTKFTGAAWANSSFDKCRNITINNSGSETLINFPAYINLSYDPEMQPNFTDIRFYNSSCNNSGTIMDYEIENYTDSAEADVWVRIPSLPSTGTTISVYYKNNTAIASGQNPIGVWDNNYAGVWHMHVANATDSTSNSNNCYSSKAGNISRNSSGTVDGSVTFYGTNATNYYLNCSNASVLNPANVTLEAWVYIKSGAGNSVQKAIVAKGTSPYQYNMYQQSGTPSIYSYLCNASACLSTPFSGWSVNLTNFAWYYLAVTYNQSLIQNYQNGQVNVSQVMTGALNTTTQKFGIGGYITSFYQFNGTIDEVRVSNVSRSASWINQTYLMMAQQNSYVTIGAEYDRTGGVEGTPVTACRDLNETNTVYKLSKDISSDSGVCFNITANNVTLNGDEFSLTYAVLNNNSNAIYSKDYSSITIKNLRIYQPNTSRVNSTAIIIINSQNNSIDNISLLIYGKTNPDSYNRGIYLNNTQYSNITNSNITMQSCDYCNAIHLVSGSNNTYIANNNITVFASYSSNIYSSSSNQLSIYNNNIQAKGYAISANAGIYLYDSDNCVINQTLINATGTGDQPIHLDTNSDSNLITNTNIITSVYYAITIEVNSDYNNITYTNITSTSYRTIYMVTPGDGTYIDHVNIQCDYECVYASAPTDNVRIENSNFTMGSSGATNCVIFLGGNNWTINNTNITAPDSWRGCGIYLPSSGSLIDNITIANSKIQTYGYDSAWAFRAQTDNPSGMILIQDSIINASNYTDIYFQSSGSMTFNLTNVTITDVSWNAIATGVINRFWYLNAYVNNTAGNIIESANVTGFDINQNQTFTELTNSSGRISRQTLLAYTQNSNTNVTYSYPYILNTSAINYYNDSRSIDLDGDKDVIITLTNASLPDVIILSPINGRTYSSTTIQINITNSSNTNNVWYKWNNTNYTYAVPTNFDFKIEGNHTLTAYANNSNGISSETVNFNISLGAINLTDCQDLDSPNMIYQLIQNITSDSGTCFEIKADNVTLDGRGYTLTYANTGGGKVVRSDGYNEATIKNLIIRQPNAARSTSPAIDLENSQGNNITNNSVYILGETYTSGGYNYGVYLYNTTGTSISQNNISTNCGYCRGISLEAGSNNTVVSSNIITTRDSYAYNIYSENSNQQIIYNNTLYDYGVAVANAIDLYNTDNSIINQSTITVSVSSYGRGINLESDSDSNLITNTIITPNVGYAIYLDNYCDYNNITYTRISMPSDQYGIYIYGLDAAHTSGNYIDNVNINCSAICIDGYYSDNGIISNSNLKSTASGSGVIYLFEAYDWVINNTNVTGFGRGVTSLTADNLSIFNTNITVNGTTNGEAFYSGSTGGTVIIKDSVINSIQRNDTYFSTGSAKVNFTNVNFTDKEWASAGQKLNVFWYLDVYVNDSNSNPLPSANVSLIDNDSVLMFDTLTGANGWITRLEVQQYMQTNNINISNYNNYTANASKQTYTNSSQKLNLTTNSVLYFTLTGTDTTPPIVNINVSLNNTITSNSTPSIDFNFTDTQSVIATCTLYFNGTGYNTTANINNNSQTTLTANPSLTASNYSVYINCTDNGGNTGKSAVLNIKVVDNYINITLNINPNPASPSQNISLYGHLNHSTGLNVSYNTIYLYINHSLHYYNNYTGMIENTTPWMDTSWKYRTKINITSLVSTNLNNTIVLVNLSTSNLISQNKMNADCGDTRFGDINGNELPYTLENSTCNSANTTYWVWMNLTGNANNTVYAYYGNNASTVKTDYTNPDEKLELLMHLDNSSVYGENSSRFYDFSKSGNNGSCSGTSCPTGNSSGRYGRAYTFNGTTNYITLANTPFNFTGNFSIAVWVYFKRLGTAQSLVSKAEGGGYELAVNASNYTLMTGYSGAYIYAYSNTKMVTGQWYYLVGVVNDTSVLLYVNGVLQNSIGTLSGPVTSTAYSLTLGANPGAPYISFFNGTMDEVRVYNRTLSADEVLAMYNSTVLSYITNHSLPITDNNGNYNYTWSTSTAGNYTVKVNTTYIGLYAEDTELLTVQESATLNISLNINPNPANTNQNISFYGHVNQSDGTNITNNPISIYVNDSLINTTAQYVWSSWWNLSWRYRTKINITSLVTTNLNNTIVLVNLSTSGLISSGKMRVDCGDIRFTDTNGNELQYTTDNHSCNSTNTIFWVWSNLTGNANTTVYAYYGNSAAILKTNYTNSDSSLILYYHLDNNSVYGENSTKAYDFSKKNNNGTLIGTPTWNSTGRYGGAYNLNEGGDVGDYIQAASPTAFDFTNFTYSIWINTDLMGGGWRTIIDVDNDEQQFAIDDTGKYAFYGRCGQVSLTNAAVGWRHLAWTVSGSNYVVYENGTIIGSGSGCSASVDGDYLVIGSGYGGNEYFSGLIDEVRIYNRTLSTDEILAIYNSTAPNYIANQSLLSTDNNGNYNYTWSTAIASTYNVKVNTTYNSLYAEANGTLVVQASAGGGVNCTGYKCFITRSSGNPVVIFDALGAVDLKASLVQSSSGTPGANDFIIRNSTGSPVVWINSSGYLIIKGTLSENNGVVCTPPVNSFFIKGNNSECVAYVNNTGDLWIKGDLRENVLSASSSWADSSFDRCMNITINNSGSETLTNFPAYINLTYDNPDMLTDFKDIRFYSSSCNNGGTALDYEIENYTTSTRAHIWTRIPSLPSTGTTISVYYKNNTAISDGQNAAGVWDSNYKMVQHFAKSCSTANCTTDSTQYQNNGTPYSDTTITNLFNASGRIGPAYSFDGTNDYVTRTTAPTLNITGPMTICAWVKFGVETGNTAEIISFGDNDAMTYPYIFGADIYPGIVAPHFWWYNGVGEYYTNNGNMIVTESWQYICAVRKSDSNVTQYVNGTYVSVDQFQDDSIPSVPAGSMYIGQAAESYIFNGSIDELTVSDTNRSANWINQTYLIINNQSSYVTFGSETTR